LVSALRAAYAVEESKFEIDEERQSYLPKNRTTFCQTDPDATIAAKERCGGYSVAKPRYKSHRVVDDQCGVITAVESTPGHIYDAACLVALTEQHHLTRTVTNWWSKAVRRPTVPRPSVTDGGA
jgi:hypothetical protein